MRESENKVSGMQNTIFLRKKDSCPFERSFYFLVGEIGEETEGRDILVKEIDVESESSSRDCR